MAKELNITVDRRFPRDGYTIGNMYLDGKYFCDTCEDTDRGLKQTDSLATIKSKKVMHETAIPKGRYRVTLKVQSPKYSQRSQYNFCKGYLPRLLEVPGYDGVLIHIGNSKKDTSGCILVGKNKMKGMVLNSTETFKALYARLKEADAKGKEIWITVK